MRKKIVWLMVSGLMVISLILSSCTTTTPTTEKPTTPTTPTAPTTPSKPTTPTTPSNEMVKVKLTKADGTTVERNLEKPKYGGTFTGGVIDPPLYLDEAFGMIYASWNQNLTNECLLGGDWTKGQTGTSEAMWVYTNMMPTPTTVTGVLAESWEIQAPDTLVYHIRKGIHWHDKAPVNGREMTADDVVFSLRRLYSTTSCYHNSIYPHLKNMENLEESIYAPDKWTVVVKAIPDKLGKVYEMVSTYSKVIPPEVIQKYGDLSDWRVHVGTGPFELIDYVETSSLTFKRNPNYWMNDPFFPENQLPYVDNVKFLMIPDLSTRLAALRTAKVDQLYNLGWEEAENIKETSPELKSISYPTSAPVSIYMRVDTKPFDDVRVRRALFMAVDNKEIAEELYGGNAATLSYPVMPIPGNEDIYIPLEKLPEPVRELYEYHPDKARQLLAEAGYPEGFNTEVLLTAPDVDLLSVIAAYWADIGVDLKLDVREYGVHTSVGRSMAHKQMYVHPVNAALWYLMVDIIPGQMHNYSRVDDSRLNEAFKAMSNSYFNEAERRKVIKQIIPYELDQAYILVLPSANYYNIWQPWVKNYNGEWSSGFLGAWHDYPRWIWIDQDLKQEMTGKR